MNYEFDFSVERINCDKFKQKQVAMLRHIIEASRLMFDLEFDCYANIDFDELDEKHKHPIIEETEGFNRLKTNCLIYKMKETDTNPGFYDKLFIYQSNGSKGNGWYGWIMLNSNENKYIHKYYIDRSDDELCRQLHCSFSIMRARQKHPQFYN